MMAGETEGGRLGNVLLTGATGVVGGAVLRGLLGQDDALRVVSLGRRATGLVDDRLTEVLVADFGDAQAVGAHAAGVDAVFHCLATYSGSVSRAVYETITLDWLEVLLGAVAARAPGATFCLFSAAGARPGGGGMSFALRTKGAAETLLFASPLPRKYAFRPGYIVPSRPRERPKLMDAVMAPLQRLIPAIGVTSDQLALAMIRTARADPRPAAVLENAEIRGAGISNQ